MLTPDVDLVIVCSSGFGNTVFSDTGVRTLYRELRRRYQTATSEILHYTWDNKWSDTARRLHQVAMAGAPIIFVGHSWGCGRGYLKFEKELWKCHRSIDLAILIDPIPRPFNLFLVGNLYAMTSWGTFRVRHAREILTWRQVNNRPMGRDVVNGDQIPINRTTYGSLANLKRYAPRATAVVVDAKMEHNTIDDAGEIHGYALERIESLVAARLKGA